jgi:3-phytase
MNQIGAILAVLMATAGCATPDKSGPGVTTAQVTAVGETAAVASAKDAADDPAIWRNRADPRASLIVATDKQAGLHVYDLSGVDRFFLPALRVNNVDLRDDVEIGGQPRVLVGASDRSDPAHAAIALFTLDGPAARLAPLASVPVGAGEAYGFCLYRRARDGQTFAFLVDKDGTVRQVALDLANGAPSGQVVRTFKLATQSEGCVADDRTGLLYIAEEDVGLWRISAEPDGGGQPEAFAKVDGVRLVADAEGLAIAPRGSTAGWLVVSSQGDSAYALYDLKDGGFAGRFKVGAGRFGATSDTDGVEISLGDFGPAFPDGLMVVQDGDNAPLAQNFKLLSWRDVRHALKLP